MKNKTTYSEAITELEDIVGEIENESISIDELSDKVKRATELISFCKSQLYKTEKEVGDMLKTLDSLDGKGIND